MHRSAIARTAAERPSSRSEVSSYGRVMKAVHWLTLLLVIGAFACIWAERQADTKNEAEIFIHVHQSLGFTILGLTIFRLCWRRRAAIPRLPVSLPAIQKLAARATEYLLYGLLSVQPVLGILYTNASRHLVNLYFLGDLPVVLGPDRMLAERLIALHDLVALGKIRHVGVSNFDTDQLAAMSEIRTTTAAPIVQRILDGMTTMPAFVLNRRLDLLAANRLAVALYSPAYDDPSRPVNLARFCFLNPHATTLYKHWDEAANSTVAMLRIEAGRDPYDRELSDLVGELSTRSDSFRNRWATHNVVLHQAGAKQFHHPVVGDLSLTYEVMELSADTGLTLTAYSPEPDSTSQDGLALLASWAATHDRSDQSTSL